MPERIARLESRRVLVIRRDDIMRTAILYALREEGFSVKPYPPGTSPWVLPLENPGAVVLHAPLRGAQRAISFLQTLHLRRLPRPPIFLHTEAPDELRHLTGLGVEIIPEAAALRATRERLLALLGGPSARPLRVE